MDYPRLDPGPPEDGSCEGCGAQMVAKRVADQEWVECEHCGRGRRDLNPDDYIPPKSDDSSPFSFLNPFNW